MEVSLQNLNYKLYKNINVKIQSTLIPEKALNNPISKDRIISQVCKTNDTPFEFAEINVELEDDVFIPSIKELNEIRRMAISKLENMIIQKNKRATDFDEIKLDNLYEKYLSGFAKKFKISSGNTRLDDGSKLTGDKSIAVYLNIINPYTYIY